MCIAFCHACNMLVTCGSNSAIEAVNAIGAVKALHDRFTGEKKLGSETESSITVGFDSQDQMQGTSLTGVRLLT